jgi:hypothetical protein
VANTGWCASSGQHYYRAKIFQARKLLLFGGAICEVSITYLRGELSNRTQGNMALKKDKIYVAGTG